MPDPARLVEGLRDTGYQFNTAVADVVDNSIAADAENIAIELRMDRNGEISLKIFDDGYGITPKGLEDAMRYGAKARPSAASLGKFGLGLKTASTAFCRCLSVISRADKQHELVRATWDLDRIQREGQWNLYITPPSAEQAAEFGRFVPGGVGTLVVWEKIDRLLKLFEKPTGKPAQKAMDGFRSDLYRHLATIYQRFLDPNDTRARTVNLTLNGERVLPWDPFCEQEVKPAKQQTLPVAAGDVETSFTLRAFVLPRREEFSTEQAAQAARIGNEEQGFYVYRENRLIHGPTWLKMFAKEPHFSLMRVELSFDHQMDEAFQLDIRKSRIVLNDDLRSRILEFITPVRWTVKEDYRSRKRLQNLLRTASTI